MNKMDYPIGIAFFGLVFTVFMTGYFFGANIFSEALGGVLISIVSGYAVFYLTVTLKESEENKKAKKIVYPLVNSIISNVYFSIHNNLITTRTEDEGRFEASDLSVESLTLLLDGNNIHQKLKGFKFYYFEYDVEPESFLDQFILETTLPIQAKLERLKPYYYILDHEIIQLLTEIEDSIYFAISGNYLKHENLFEFSTDAFIFFYRDIKKLHVLTDYNPSKFIVYKGR